MDAADQHLDLENVIVVGVDGSEHATAAVEWAADAAHRRGAELRLVCAWMLPIETMVGVDLPPQSFYDSQRLWAKSVLRKESARVARVHPDVVTTTALCREFPLVALRTHSAHALMTVVGAQGSTAMAGLLMGSVAQRLVTHGAGPVVVVHRPRPESSDRIVGSFAGPVVVGLDGSTASDDALAFAFEEASFRGVPLFAIHAWDGAPEENVLVPYLSVDDITDIGLKEARGLAEQLTGWSAKYPDVAVQQHVLRGKPIKSLLDFCAAHERMSAPPALIVVGSRGHGGFLGMLLGSTSQALAAHAVNPVCVVHGRRP